MKFRNGAKDWTDPERWSLQRLISDYGTWDLYSGSSQDIVRKGGNGYLRSTFEEFVEKMFSSQPETHQELSYVFDRKFVKHTDLVSTLKLPKFFPINAKKEDYLLFLGGTETGVSFHNHAEAWNAVVYGRKRWFLYPVHQTPPGGVYPGFRQLDWFKIVYPNLSDANRPIECIQGPGEILYLPEGFYHGTINLGDTIAIGSQNKEASTDAIKYIYEENKLRGKGEEGLLDRIELMHKILDIYPNQAEAKMRLGKMYEETNQLELSIRFSQEALDLDPYFILASINLALVKEKLKKTEEAEIIFKGLMQLNPNMWDIPAQYGFFLFIHQRWQEANKAFYQAVKLEPSKKAFYLYLSMTEKKLGNEKASNWAMKKHKELSDAEASGQPINV